MNIRPMNIHAAINNAPPALDFVLPGLLAGTAGTIVGAGAVGKTTLLLQLAAVMSSNVGNTDDILPLSGIPSRIVYIAAEESADILRIRLHAICNRMRERVAPTSLLLPEGARNPVSLMEQNLCLLPAAGHSVFLLKDGAPTPFLEQLCQFCHGARLVIIDPLRRLHDGDENSSAAMTQVVQALEFLAQRTGAAVIAAHHMNKGAVFAGAADSAAASRGSSALTDAVRWQLNLSSMTEAEAKTFGVLSERKSYLRLDFAKANYIASPPTRWLKRLDGGVLMPVNLGKDCGKSSTSVRAKRGAGSDKEFVYV